MSREKSRITLLNDRDKLYARGFISTAIDFLRSEWHRSDAIVFDAVSEYMTLQAWTKTPSLYSFIEQSFKYMAGEFEEIHTLKRLYANIPFEAQSALKKGYLAYVKMNPELYKGYRSIESFLDGLDSHGGYTSWRYFLLQGYKKGKDGSEKFPIQAIHATMELANLCGQIVRSMHSDDSGTKLHMETFPVRLRKFIGAIAVDCCRSNHSNDYQGYIDIFNRGRLWAAKYLYDLRLPSDTALAPRLTQSELKILHHMAVNMRKFRWDCVQYINFLDQNNLDIIIQLGRDTVWVEGQLVTGEHFTTKKNESRNLAGGLLPNRPQDITFYKLMVCSGSGWIGFDFHKMEMLGNDWYFGLAYDRATRSNYGFAVKNGESKYENEKEVTFLACDERNKANFINKISHYLAPIDWGSHIIYDNQYGVPEIRYREMDLIKKKILECMNEAQKNSKITTTPECDVTRYLLETEWKRGLKVWDQEKGP